MRTHMFIGYIIKRFTPPGYKRAAVICKQRERSRPAAAAPAAHSAARSPRGTGSAAGTARAGCGHGLGADPELNADRGVRPGGGRSVGPRPGLRYRCRRAGAARRSALRGDSNFPRPRGCGSPPRSGRAGAAANFQPVRANFGGRLCGWAPSGGGGARGEVARLRRTPSPAARSPTAPRCPAEPWRSPAGALRQAAEPGANLFLARSKRAPRHPAPSWNSRAHPPAAERRAGLRADPRCVCVCVFEGGRDPAGADRAAGAQRDPQHPRLAAPPGD